MQTVSLPRLHRARPPVAPKFVGNLGALHGRAVDAVFALGVVYVVTLWGTGGGIAALFSPLESLTSFGRLSGLLASYFLLCQVLGMARVPWIERAYGQPAITARHRVLGYVSFSLMLAHIATIVLGYASLAGDGAVGTFITMLRESPGILLAVAGTAALIAVVATSIRAARRSMTYESWHLIHLYGYLGAGLALPHQLWMGADFTRSAAAEAFWWGLWGATALAVVVYRVGFPVYRSVRFGLRVDSVEPVGPHITRITMTGRNLDRLRVRAGQYFTWRFAGAAHPTRGHPFSLSAAPDGLTLQIMVACVGDDTADLKSLPRGSKVSIEGPYGRLHVQPSTSSKVLLLGAGIGASPLRAIMEDLHPTTDAVLLYRTSSAEDDALLDDLRGVAERHGVHLLVLAGPRNEDAVSWLPAAAASIGDDAALLRLVPDVAERDVFCCGGGTWTHAATGAARRCGVSAHRIHTESFDR